MLGTSCKKERGVISCRVAVVYMKTENNVLNVDEIHLQLIIIIISVGNGEIVSF